MRGSDVKFKPGLTTGVITEAKKTSESALSAPSATPVVLLNERNRPVTANMYCHGPTAPLGSGGNGPSSVSVAAGKVMPSGWAWPTMSPGVGAVVIVVAPPPLAAYACRVCQAASVGAA